MINYNGEKIAYATFEGRKLGSEQIDFCRSKIIENSRFELISSPNGIKKV